MIKLFTLSTLLALATVLVGCGSSDDTKPPEGGGYYSGEMKPKGGGAPAAETPSKLGGGANDPANQ